MKKQRCYQCHKPAQTANRLCKTCRIVREKYRSEEARQESRRMARWVR